MSQHDPHDGHSSFIKTPKQLIAVVILAFVVPILVIAMLAHLASQSVDPSVSVESKEAIAERLKPVGEVVVDPNAPAPPTAAPVSISPAQVAAAAAPAAAGAAPTPAAEGGAGKGKAVYDTTCHVCHGAGVAGAPKLGDKAAWAPRIKQGLDALHQSALKGKGAMPPKGGNTSLSDADVQAAVDFMVSQSK
jgi:cytochrome c5